MNEKEFNRLISQASAAPGDYSDGYRRGLRRYYHGCSFGTATEHQRWLGLGLDGDPRHELGRGYRDGFAGIPPQEGPKRRARDEPPDADYYYDPSPQYLRRVIAAAGLSQREAARRIGVPERSMRCYLADRSAATAQTAPYAVQVALEQLKMGSSVGMSPCPPEIDAGLKPDLQLEGHLDGLFLGGGQIGEQGRDEVDPDGGGTEGVFE